MNRWRVLRGRIERWAAHYHGPRFHALLCDPPYELGFMGRDWDKSGVSFNPETWAALAEHLYPGAFGMAFASSRGWHRLACAIEDAGLIIHPTVWKYWSYGSGFPKATRIDTQVDAAAGAKREMCNFSPGTKGRLSAIHAESQSLGKNWTGRQSIPATPLAAAWEGHRYGLQAIKPAVEPIIVFSKPYEGRPVESITETGAGALWIDGGRIGFGSEESWIRRPTLREPSGTINFKSGCRNNIALASSHGRWPANLCLVHVSLPVMRLCGKIPSDIQSEIRRYFDGYTNLSTVRAVRGTGRMASQEGTEVLQRGLCEYSQERQDASGVQAGQDDIVLSSMQQGVRGMEGMGQTGTPEVLQLGLQDSIPEDLNGAKECQVWGNTHRRNKTEDKRSTEAKGRGVSQLAGGEVQYQPGLSVCACGESKRTDTPTGRANGNQAGLCSGTPPSNGDDPRASSQEIGEGTSPQWRKDRQQAGESSNLSDGRTFAETSRDRPISKQATEGKRNIEGRERALEVLACDIPEQWLVYFEPTGEDLGCRRVGSRRVRGSGGAFHFSLRSKCKNVYNGGWGNTEPSLYARDMDGLETIDDWECHADCPARALGEQSGVTKSSGGLTPGVGAGDGRVYSFGNEKGANAGGLGDTGTAARFFFQADWALEQADPVFYQSKAGRAERDAGLSDMPTGCNPHPAVKPLTLCKWLATLLLPPQEYAPRRILVPFAGSGGEMIGALLVGWEWILGIELLAENVRLAEARLAWWADKSRWGQTDPAVLLREREPDDGQLELWSV